MGKHTDELGSIDNFQAPWESETGSDAEIDATKLKKYLFNLMVDKAKAQDARDDAAGKVTEIQTALDEAKGEVAKGDPTGKIAELEGKLSKAEAAKVDAEKGLLRLTVATEKGLTPAQAKRLQGETEEELKADADEILEIFAAKAPANDETDEDEDGPSGRTTPRANLSLVNPGDSGNGGAEYDYEKIASDIAGGRTI